MKRSRINYFIDVLMVLDFTLLFFTGILKFPRLLPSLGLRHAFLPMNTISLVHDWSGITLGILIMLHLALHCRWLWAMTKGFFGGRK